MGTDGLVSEGSGENIFVIKNGSIYTPESCFAILPGITRHTAITLIRDLGMRVEQRGIPREFLYIADEVFFTGTAAELRRSVPSTKYRSAVGSAGRSPRRYRRLFRSNSRRSRGSARMVDLRVMDLI